MRRAVLTSVVLAAAGLALAVPGAPAGPRHARVYHAILRPIPVGVYGLVPHTRGRAQLVDGRKNDKVSIHVRGLQPGLTYPWHVHVAKGPGDPCDLSSGANNPSPVPGWTYRPLKANGAGRANAKGRSHTFSADPTKTYYVDVHLPSATGEILACGVLRTKGHHGHGQGKSHGNGPKPGKGPKH
jgi:hypothetical protein